MKFPRWRRRPALPALTGYPQRVTVAGRPHHVTGVSSRRTWDGWETTLDLVDEATYRSRYRIEPEPLPAGTVVTGDEDTTTVNVQYLTALEAAAAKLGALEAMGVDNWTGYETALEDAGIAPWQNTENGDTTS